MGRVRLAIPLALVLAMASAPSLAADQAVHATSSNTFTPKTVTINVGESVTFTNDGGFHNVKFEDGKFEQPSDPDFTPWTVKRTFDQPGTYRYYCEQHGGPGGVGMSGTVVVEGAGGGGGGGGGDTTAPAISSPRVSPSSFCTKKTKVCHKPGARLRFTLSEDATVTGRVFNSKTGSQVGGTLTFAGKSGANDFKFTGHGLKLGKYRLALTAKDGAGNASPTAKTSFRIAKKHG